MIVRLLAASFTLLAASCSTIISVTREEEGGWQVVEGQAVSWVVVANMTDLREEEGWLQQTDLLRDLVKMCDLGLLLGGPDILGGALESVRTGIPGQRNPIPLIVMVSTSTGIPGQCKHTQSLEAYISEALRCANTLHL